MKFTVVIPTYNRPDFLEACLNAVFAQETRLDEVIVVDDCSSNIADYRKVFEKFAMKENLIVKILDSNSGAPHARNIGAQIASGDYLLFCDDDDYWLPDHVTECANTISKNVDASLIYSGARVVEDGSNVGVSLTPILECEAKKRILRNCFISSPAVCIKSTLFNSLGGFDRRFKSCQDWDMWARLILADPRLACTNKVTTVHNVHSGERIGYSKRAWRGYVRFFGKHFLSILKTDPKLLGFHIYYIGFHVSKRLMKRALL